MIMAKLTGCKEKHWLLEIFLLSLYLIIEQKQMVKIGL